MREKKSKEKKINRAKERSCISPKSKIYNIRSIYIDLDLNLNLDRPHTRSYIQMRMPHPSGARKMISVVAENAQPNRRQT